MDVGDDSVNLEISLQALGPDLQTYVKMADVAASTCYPSTGEVASQLYLLCEFQAIERSLTKKR